MCAYVTRDGFLDDGVCEFVSAFVTLDRELIKITLTSFDTAAESAELACPFIAGNEPPASRFG